MIIAASGEEGGDPAGQDHVRRAEGAGRGQEREGSRGAGQHCLLHQCKSAVRRTRWEMIIFWMCFIYHILGEGLNSLLL